MLEHLSVSQLTTYLGCPRRYAYRYVEKAPPERRSSALAFGIALHETLRWLLEHRMSGDTPGWDAARLAFRQAWDDAVAPGGFEESAEELAELGRRGEQLVHAYLEHDQVLVPDDVEARVVVDLVDPRTGRPLDVPLLGYVDALAGSTVVEFKTAARKASPWKWRLQLAAYSIAFRKQRGSRPTMRVVQLVKTKEPQVVVDDVRLTDADEAWFVELAAEVLTGIRSGVFFPNPGWMCRSCEFRDRCGVP